MVICPDCGKEVPKEKFCKNCGAYLADIEVPVPIENTRTIPVDAAEGSSEEVKEIVIQDASKSDNGYKYCFNCGFELTGEFKFCPNCGQDLSGNVNSKKTPAVSKEKNILLAVILSVLLPGLGQIYLGLDHKGAIFLIAYVISAILILLLIGFVLVFILWIWALIDTIISANALNRGEEVEDKLF